MENTSITPTPYPEINKFLRYLLENVKAVLKDYFSGIYLYGSLASGDFDPDRSDIDLLVVTSGELPESVISDLEAMHTRIFYNGPEWATKLEGAYIPVDAMRVYSPTGPVCPLVNKSEFLVARPDSNWVLNRHILYTHGVVITGPPLQTIIDQVQPEQLREAVLTLLRNNWASLLNNTDIFAGAGHQAFVVLTMCRALHTLEHGVVVSKKVAAEWAITAFDEKWKELIKQATNWHYGEPPGDIRQTQEFMRYTLKRAGV